MNETNTLLQTVIALVFVLCLIGLCALAARRFAPMLAKTMQTRGGRLQLLEVMALDPRHRAVLLRCDAEEHLLVLGEGGVTVVAHHPAAVTAPEGPAS